MFLWMLKEKVHQLGHILLDVASLMGELIDLNAKHQTFSPSEADLQYVTPHCHRDMLLTFAETYRRKFSIELRNSLALSL